jgi:hypothetical protein
MEGVEIIPTVKCMSSSGFYALSFRLSTKFN